MPLRGNDMYRIYIVEDDQGIAEGISAALTGWRFECHIASAFSDILAEFQQVQPHLVLLDIMLPFYNVYHWCSEIRKVSVVYAVVYHITSNAYYRLVSAN